MDETKTQNVPETIDAGTLADRLLGNPLPNVDYLIERLSPPIRTERETPLLEFKASYLPEEGDSSSVDACKWNVVEAIVSMANATGGCILLGVKEMDDHRLVACGCDPHGILDHPGRESKDLIGKTVKELFHPNGVYECDDKRSFTLNEPKEVLEHVRFRLCHSEEMGDNVIAIIVSPVPEGGDLLTVKKTVSRNGEKTSVAVLFHRDELFPRNNPIEDIAGHFSEYDSYRRNRRVGRKAYAELLRPEAALWERIRRSHERLLSRLDGFEWNSFVPLDAKESEDGIQPAAVKPINLDSFFLPDDGGSRPDNHGGSGNDRPASGATPPNRPLPDAGPKSLDDLFKASRRFCLIGEPGAGKTTGIRHFVRNRILSRAQHEELFAYVPLGAWGSEGSLTGLTSQTTGLSPGELEASLLTGRAMVFLDGLNECPDDYKENAKLQIRSFLQSHPNCGVVVSARHIQEVRGFGLPVWELEPFDSSRRRRFLELRLGDARKADDLISRLEAQPGGESFLRNPLLLQMMADCVLDSPDSALPTGRAGLYRRCVDRWIVRERTKAVRAGLPDPEQTLLAAIQRLQRLAFKSRKSGLRHIPRKMVMEDASDQTGPSFPEGIDLPFVFAGENEIQFRHETFQEYFCAEWIVRHPQSLSSLSRFGYDTWGMPLAFAFEMTGGETTPRVFLEAAKKTNLWFFAAIAATEKNRNTIGPELRGKNGLLSPFGLVLMGSTEQLKQDDYSSVFLLAMNGKWYSRNDAPLRHVLSVDKSAADSWKRFELSVFRLLFANDSKHVIQDEFGRRIVASFLLLSLSDCLGHRGFKSDQNESRIADFSISIANACEMLTSGFAKFSDFPIGHFSRLQEYIKRATLEEAEQIIDAGLLPERVFRSEVKRWALANPVHVLAVAKQRDWLSEEQCRSWALSLIESLSPRQGVFLLLNGILDRADLAPIWTSRIMTASVPDLFEMLQASIIPFWEYEEACRYSQRSDEAVIRLWKSGFWPWQEDIDHILEERQRIKWDFQNDFFDSMLYKDLALFEAGLITQSSFFDFWKSSRTIVEKAIDPKDFFFLPKSQNDWKPHHYRNVVERQIRVALLLLQSGLSKPCDFADLFSVWKVHCSFGNALRLLRFRCFSPDCFTNRKSEWAQQLLPKDVFAALETNLYTLEEIKDIFGTKNILRCADNLGKLFFARENWWSKIPEPFSSGALRALGACDIATYLSIEKEPLQSNLLDSIHNASSCYVARWLVPFGLARKEQFLPRVSEWLDCATGEDVVNLALDGWIDFETAKKKLLELNSQGNLTPAFLEPLALSIPELREQPQSESAAK